MRAGILNNFFLALRDVMVESANVQPVYGYVSGLDFFQPRDALRQRWRLVAHTKQDIDPRLFYSVDAVFLATGTRFQWAPFVANAYYIISTLHHSNHGVTAGSEPRRSVSATHMRSKRDLSLTLALGSNTACSGSESITGRQAGRTRLRVENKV